MDQSDAEDKLVRKLSAWTCGSNEARAFKLYVLVISLEFHIRKAKAKPILTLSSVFPDIPEFPGVQNALLPPGRTSTLQRASFLFL